MTLFLLCIFAFFAGFVDAIGGGGGLIQLPALFILRGDLAHPFLIATNKMSAVTGTAAATVSYLRRIAINWRLVRYGMAAAAVFSWLGAQIVSLLSPAIFRPLMLILLIGVAIYTFRRKHFGLHARTTRWSDKPLLPMIVICAAVGFYDGFFGPGTGSFLMVAFVGILGMDFLNASATTKVINVTTNVAALVFFALNHTIIYSTAIPMGICNAGGGWIGSHLALKHGSQFVRRVFLLVVVGVILRFGYDVVLGK